MITTSGWVVKVKREDTEALYNQSAEAADDTDGTVSYADLGGRLESILEKRVTAAR